MSSGAGPVSGAPSGTQLAHKARRSDRQACHLQISVANRLLQAGCTLAPAAGAAALRRRLDGTRLDLDHVWLGRSGWRPCLAGEEINMKMQHRILFWAAAAALLLLATGAAAAGARAAVALALPSSLPLQQRFNLPTHTHLLLLISPCRCRATLRGALLGSDVAQHGGPQLPAHSSARRPAAAGRHSQRGGRLCVRALRQRQRLVHWQ